MRNFQKEFFAAATVLTATFSCPGNVLVNEIMYHSPTENVRECFVELYNPDTNTVDLAGWRFTRGIEFAFPTNTSTLLAPGAFLVVAADAATFTAKYPGVANFVAGWSGQMRSHLTLENAAGQEIDDVDFSNDGDWAARILTTNGFAYFGHAGWMWTSGHDGLGYSLELMNANLPNNFGHNWNSSTVLAGTPGRANSVAQNNIAPMITGVAHAPVIPKPSDVVTVSARLLDEETTGLSLTVYYRVAMSTTPPAFTAAAMFDDGAHNDGLAGDRIFGALLPPQPNGTVVEFYLIGQDLQGNTRRYPNEIPPTTSSRTANLLYQVDNDVYAGSQPVYRIIMTERERGELYTIGGGCPDMDSDAQMNATWISVDGESSGGTTTQLRYNCGVRNRGHGSRSARPNNYHVNIPGDRKWKDSTGINLNSQYAYMQVLGSALFRRAGVPMPESRAVQVRVNSTNLMASAGNSFGSYAANEQYDEAMLQRAFPLDPNGNCYRGNWGQSICDSSHNQEAGFTWFGANYNQAGYTNAYFKQNNLLENDWSDLIDLIAVFNSQNGHSSANYAADVRARINVEEWMQYMALNIIADNEETALATGEGDDYVLYRGVNDTRFLALPYDLDQIFRRGAQATIPRLGIWRMLNVGAMNRFMKTPEFAPRYFYWLKTYCDTLLSPAEMNPLLDKLFVGWVPQDRINNLKAYNASQGDYIRSFIALSLTVSDSLSQVSGYPYTTTPTVTLYGTANAIRTRSIRVNGIATAWTAWTASWTNTAVQLHPGLNRVLVQAFDENGVEFESAHKDVWYNDGAVTSLGGALAGSQVWAPALGPYYLSNSVSVPNGMTLTILPGTTVYLNSGANLVVENGGRLLAEGTFDAPIRFTRQPGSGVSWGGIIINGAGASPETRIAHAFFDFNNSTAIYVNGGTLYLDHCSFGNTVRQYLSLDNASFLVSDCHFPDMTDEVEPVHGGGGGIKAGGRGIIRNCYFGRTIRYSDAFDFTGGNRDSGQPILQVYNNVFAGSTDDHLDLDGTDAWVEGNIFLHVHRNNSPDSASAISGGSDGSATSQITAIGNIFYDCDQAATAKQGNFYTLLNNTIVRTTRNGGVDTGSGVINLYDPGVTYGAGFYLEGNIIVDAEQLARDYLPAQSLVTFNNNILPMPWTGPGTNNLVGSPLLKYIPSVNETAFTNWQTAQVLRDWFSLLPGSPGLGTGPNGRDMGGVVPIGASVSGEPVGTNNLTTATLRVGSVRSGFGISAPGWPLGSGYTHYMWRLDEGPWNAETPIATPINLAGLANGSHQVDVVGRRDSGTYQDDPAFGPDAPITSSRVWVVDTSYVPPARPTIRLNEILAQNSTALTNAGTTPDMVEIYNYGPAAVDLAGLSLSDNAAISNKFTFPAGTPLLGPRQYLRLFADNAIAAPGIHLGFSLKTSGDDLYLFDRPASGQVLLDSVAFGVQIPDYSIGRGVDGTWTLCRPTFGTNNYVLQLGDQHQLKLNEWLADELFLDNNDFVEIHNPGELPVALGGCYLSDAEGSLARHPIAPLSFIGPGGYLSFVADGDFNQGADHLAFKLEPSVGILLLSDSNLEIIDAVDYGPQTTDVSQGRSPNGSDTFTSFVIPTPGAANPVPNGVLSVTNIAAEMVSLLHINSPWRYDTSGGTNLGTAWYQTSYPAETNWPLGLGLFGTETAGVYPYPFRTAIPGTRNGGKIAVYYRAHFQWNGSLTDYTLVSTNFVDDGAVFYLNGVRMSSSLRMPASVNYNTFSSGLAPEAVEYLSFANRPVIGDNVMAVEVHQNNTDSSDHAFGMLLNAVHYTTNVITTITGIPVVLNEILASNHSVTNADGTTSDWIELHNVGTNLINLGDLSLTDDPNAPRKYVFGPSSTIGPGGYLVIYCNNDLPASAANTGFSLDAEGGSVLLFNSPANGGGLVDGVHYGLQAADFPIGRIPDGSGNWALNVPTPRVANIAAGLATVSSLKINEWMADPLTGPDWFEVYNAASLPVSIGGLAFTDDLTTKTLSVIPPLSFIGVGTGAFVKFVADNDQNAGANHVNFALSRSGEEIGLFSPAGIQIDAVTFQLQLPGVPQGRFPDGSTSIVSLAETPSPAESNYLPLPNIVVDEVLTHTDPPLEDAVEFYNSGPAAANIGGWFISNDPANLKKYRVPDNTYIGGHSYKVLYEYQFNPVDGSSIPFAFNSAHGDRVYLSQADATGTLTGYRAPALFGAADNGVSFGRYTNSVGQVDLVPLSSRTFGMDNPATLAQFRLGGGALNAYPNVGPLVIIEIMFYPPMSGLEDDTQSEYVELRNVSSYDLPLYDPLASTNTWRVTGGISYTFPENVHVPPGGYVLLVNFDPEQDVLSLANFRARYNVPVSVPLFGPYGANLANNGEAFQVERPDAPQVAPHPDAGFVPYILVERVVYLNATPWPLGAGGTGSSLQRQVPTNYGNDPANWFVAAPTPGQPNISNPDDANGDGLPDAWQLQNFGSITSPNAAPGADPDADGFNNVQEYLAGTNPNVSSSRLQIDFVQASGTGRTIHFTAVPGKTYSILFKDDLNETFWLTATNISGVSGPVSIPDPGAPQSGLRFYRLVTPQLP